MTRRTLYFEIYKKIWTAEAEVDGWKVLSPESEELGFICEDGATYYVRSEQLGLKFQRNTVEKAICVIVEALNTQKRLKDRTRE